jgi:hypothetical protein
MRTFLPAASSFRHAPSVAKDPCHLQVHLQVDIFIVRRNSASACFCRPATVPFAESKGFITDIWVPRRVAHGLQGVPIVYAAVNLVDALTCSIESRDERQSRVMILNQGRQRDRAGLLSASRARLDGSRTEARANGCGVPCLPVVSAPVAAP